MGYYGGHGRAQGRHRCSRRRPCRRTSPPADPASTGLVDCGNWAVSASWAVPADAVSGIYFAKLVRADDTGGASHIVFVVRDDDGDARTSCSRPRTRRGRPTTTYGGNSLYTGLGPPARAYKVSYNRPFTTRGVRARATSCSTPSTRWSAGWSATATTSATSPASTPTARGARAAASTRRFLSVGHDEYWSGQQRANVEAARDAGVHLAFFSGNEVFWKTRWEPSIDGPARRTARSSRYKETHANAQDRPRARTWTGTWRDPRFSPPADGGRPGERADRARIFTVNGMRDDAITGAGRRRQAALLAQHERSPTLAAGRRPRRCPTGTLGYEWDEDLDNGFRPAGLDPPVATTVDIAPARASWTTARHVRHRHGRRTP